MPKYLLIIQIKRHEHPPEDLRTRSDSAYLMRMGMLGWLEFAKQKGVEAYRIELFEEFILKDVAKHNEELIPRKPSPGIYPQCDLN